MSTTVVLKAPDISCPHCAMAIKRELTPTVGVQAVSVDVPTKQVTLTVADEAALARAKAALAAIGYPVQDV